VGHSEPAPAEVASVQGPGRQASPRESHGRSWRRRAATAAALLVVSVLLALFVIDHLDSEEPGFTFVVLRGGEERALSEDGVLRDKDQLALRVDVDETSCFYVFSEDDEGRQFAMFPNPRYRLANPLSSGSVLLPGPGVNGEPPQWEIYGENAIEHFYIVCSEKPYLPAEQLLSEILAQGGSTSELPEAMGLVLRGARPAADVRQGRVRTLREVFGSGQPSAFEADGVKWYHFQFRRADG
jgi:hypothetical protein